MSTVLLAAKASSVPRPAHNGWLRGFGMRQLAIAAGFAILIPLIGVTHKLINGTAPQAVPVLEDSLACFILALSAMLGVVVADNRLRGWVGPAPRVAVAALAGALLGTALMEAAIRLVLRPLGFPEGVGEGPFLGEAHRIAQRFAEAATWSFMLVALYALFQESRRANQELHAVRIAALAAEREVVEGELRAVQARVDPDVLFGTLLDIDRAYAVSIASGEQVLDALIASLREAGARGSH